MKKNIEVEFTGKISKEQFDSLKNKFQQVGKLKKNKKRISFMYFKNSVPEKYSAAEDDEVDLRMRITNGEPEIIVKQGKFTASHSRKETSIFFKSSEIKKYVDFLMALGWKCGVIYAAETQAYEYKGIELSLVEIIDYGYNFEAEILTEESKVESAKKKINEELKILGLKSFDKDELDKQCNAINNKKELQFDFSKQSFEEIKEGFNEFF